MNKEFVPEHFFRDTVYKSLTKQPLIQRSPQQPILKKIEAY
jgi:hypothetical protein